jgi:hypothetical protein
VVSTGFGHRRSAGSWRRRLTDTPIRRGDQLVALRHTGALGYDWEARVSNIELIVAALTAGASAGVTNTATVAVQDAYAGLKSLLRPWVRGEARAALDADEAGTGVWQARLAEDLEASGAAEDGQLLAAAEQLLTLIDAQSAGKYRVDASQAKGVQVGDGNTQTNTFS